MALERGTIIDGKYTLKDQLDAGNMGQLWLASQKDKRNVALKFVLQDKPELRPRFEAEIEAVVALQNAYTVRIYEWGMFEEAPYMVMEYLVGRNLADVLRERGPLPVAVAVDYVVQAACGAEFAHRAGVIHRDLKPANVFVEDTGGIKLIDFGIAGTTKPNRARMTAAGSYMGTPNYSAPEQFVDASAVDARADIWALGAILYELLTGRLAFPEEYPDVVDSVQHRDPPPIAELRTNVPERVVECVNRCLRKRPADRYEHARDLITALCRFGSGAAQVALRAVQSPDDPWEAQTHFDSSRPVSADPSAAGRQSTFEPTTRTDPPHSSPRFGTLAALVDAVITERSTPHGQPRQIVFMLGAGFSMPAHGRKGVPGTSEIVDLILKRVPAESRPTLKAKLAISKNRYQTAFDYLVSTGELDAANGIIRQAVLRAYESHVDLPLGSADQERICATCENDPTRWSVPPGIEHLGRIVSEALKDSRHRRFGALHLTTNFDPLLAVSIARQGGLSVPHPVEVDLRIPQAERSHCKLVHVHGYWRQGQTLHNDLDKDRPLLRHSLQKLLEESTLVVLGYGGWDDVFMQALKAVANPLGTAEILWGFFDKEADVLKQRGPLLRQLAIHGERIKFYADVDTNVFFEQLAAKLLHSEAPPPPSKKRRRVGIELAVVSAVALMLGLTVAIVFFGRPLLTSYQAPHPASDTPTSKPPIPVSVAQDLPRPPTTTTGTIASPPTASSSVSSPPQPTATHTASKPAKPARPQDAGVNATLDAGPSPEERRRACEQNCDQQFRLESCEHEHTLPGLVAKCQDNETKRIKCKVDCAH